MADQQFCAFLGEACDPKKYHPLFQWMVMIGTALSSGGSVDREKLELRLSHEDYASLQPKEKEAMVKFLCIDYNFDAWRTGR